MNRFVPAALLVFSSAALNAQSALGVTVFNDRNGNGKFDAGERAIPGVAVSNQQDVTATDAAGVARIDRGPTGVVFVSVPSGYRSVGAFWRQPVAADSQLAFALQAAPAPRTFSFVHASDPHIQRKAVDRTRRLRQLVDSLKPDFGIITGDLIYDSMSQQEPAARSYFELFQAETKNFPAPLWLVPGNHDHFGIIPSRSHVPETHPLYDRGMYRLYFGPDYYSFTYGGVHFVALNTLMRDDSAYYGRVDSLQLEWLKRDLAMIPASMPVVTFNHIPMVSAWEILNGFVQEPGFVASIRTDHGQLTSRHTVANVRAVMTAMKGHRWVLALGGHMHAAEKTTFNTEGGVTRFEQTGAVVGQWDDGELVSPSVITYYTVRDGVIDAGRYVRLDPPAKSPGR